MRTVVFASAALCLAAAAQDKKYESKDGKYAVAFPAAPETEAKKAGDVTLHSATAQGAGAVFVVTYSDLPVKAAKPADVLADGEKELVAGFKAKASGKETTFGPDKLPAREVTGELAVDMTALHLRATLVLSGGRLYQVLAVGTKEAVTGKAGDAFFASFELKK
jgi:hypothetical protein